MGLTLVYGLNTHIHADHVTGTGRLKQLFPQMCSVLSVNAGGCADVYVKHGDKICFPSERQEEGVVGQWELEVRETPGHTSGCLTYVSHSAKKAFTGDALLIRGCGRTDFQNGDARMLYQSVHQQILSLPSDYLLYPAHDYTGRTTTTVEEEKLFNTRLTKTEDEFVETMRDLRLPYPHQIDKAVPANKVCGIYELMDENLRRQVQGKA
jgi:sulfur dioxygenase